MGVAVRRACGVKVALVYNIGEYRNCSAIVSHFLLLYYGINLTEKESSKHVPLLAMTFFFLCTTVFFFHKGTALSSCQRLVVKNAEVQRPGQSLKQLLTMTPEAKFVQKKHLKCSPQGITNQIA